MLQADNLSKSYSADPIFEGVCFQLQKGEKCALVGRNGSGKTTLFKILKGEETSDAGSFHAPKGYSLGFLEQHITFTEKTALEEALSGPISKEPYEVESILFGLGFNDTMLDADPSSLSGGYHLRLKLAKLLAKEPDCLLLDEPTNYLDIAGLRWLEGYLKSWRKECILISHDRSFLDSVITHTMGLHRKGLKKWKGDTENFYQKILEEEELYEKTRITVDKKRKHLEGFIDRFGAKASKATQAKSKAKSLNKLTALTKLSSLDELSFSFSYDPFNGKKILDLQNISFGYEKDSPIIKSFSLELEKGKKIAIIGKNGKGKSTLLKLMAGELSPDLGSVFLSEKASIGYFGQTNISSLHDDHTIEEEIATSNTTLNYTAIRSICGAMMFSKDSAKKKISLLSGGERSRVLLGKILASKTNLLLLDEPTHHLDIESIESLLDAILTFEGSVILVTHSEEMLHRIDTDALIVFKENGPELFLGSYAEFLEKDGWGDSPKKAKKNKKDLSKKDRALAVQKRSLELGPIKSKVESLEKKVEAKEKELKDTERLLVKASEVQDSQKIQTLSVSSATFQKELETLYKELEESYEHLESLKP